MTRPDTGAGAVVAADPDLVRVLTELFAAYRAARPSPEGPPRAEVDVDRALWARLEELGLTRLTTPVSRGGGGASWVDAAALLRLAAAAAAPVPLVEHDLLAEWLLHAAGLPNEVRLRTVCRPYPSGTAVNVTFGRAAGSVVALWEDGERWRVSDVPVERIRVTPCRNLAGAPSDTLDFDLADLEAGELVDDLVGRQFHLRGALARCAQVSGAMGRILEVVVAHACLRRQFGRPLAGFQAVQALVADLAAEASLARAATDAAVARAAASDWRDPGMLFAVGVAKSCVGHASSVVVRNAHQVLGAMGTTLEHELHRLTEPVLVWRSEFGSIHEWDETLTRLATGAGPDRLWQLVTTGRAAQP